MKQDELSSCHSDWKGISGREFDTVLIDNVYPNEKSLLFCRVRWGDFSLFCSYKNVNIATASGFVWYWEIMGMCRR